MGITLFPGISHRNAGHCFFNFLEIIFLFGNNMSEACSHLSSTRIKPGTWKAESCLLELGSGSLLKFLGKQQVLPQMPSHRRPRSKPNVKCPLGAILE